MRLDLPFRTERLRLREFQSDEARLHYDLDHDPGVMEFFNRPPMATMEEYERFLQERVLGGYERHPGLGIFAAETVQGEFIGWFCLRPAREYAYCAAAGFDPEDLEVGYRLRTASWGQGFATEGARALTEAALREAPRVVAATRIDNVKSQRVLEKCGLKRFGEPWTIDPGFPEGISFARDR